MKNWVGPLTLVVGIVALLVALWQFYLFVTQMLIGDGFMVRSSSSS